MYTQLFTLSGLTCTACKKVSEKRIGAINGVQTVSVDLKTSKATVESNSNLSLDQIQASLTGTPYEATQKETL